ncbi:MAG: branched-chain amino acid ABC transporter permease [Acidimicrobiales bacterium]
MNSLEAYLFNLAIFAAINAITVIGLNLQFGTAGLLNLAYIVLVAVGAYATGIASLHPAAALHSHYISYIGGFGWQFPWNLLFGIVVTVAVGLLLGIIVFSRVSLWYMAVALVSIGYAFLTIINDVPSLFNGYIGLSNVAMPFQGVLSGGADQFAFLAICIAGVALVLGLAWRLERAPIGRVWRAIREDEVGAQALGKRAFTFRLSAFALGSAAAGLAGGLTVMYLGSWNTEAWQPNETFLIFAALIVGGRGWSMGGVLGSLLVYDALIDGSKYIPVVGHQLQLLPFLQAVFLAAGVMAMLWWRPYGLWPEPKDRVPKPLWAGHGMERAAPTAAAEQPPAVEPVVELQHPTGVER